MTTPVERSRAVLQMGDAAAALIPYAATAASDAERVEVPAYLLRTITRALRHFPTTGDIDQSSRAAPKIWGTVR